MKKNIKNYLFALKILLGIAQSLFSFSFSLFSSQINKNLALMIAYFLIFTQVIIIFSYYNQTRIEQKSSLATYNTIVSDGFNLSRINTIEVFSTDNVDCSHELVDKPINSSLLSRDFIINCAFKHLASGNEEQYLKNIELAKQIDPNWIGWKK